jgi:hypothetical protein
MLGIGNLFKKIGIAAGTAAISATGVPPELVGLPGVNTPNVAQTTNELRDQVAMMAMAALMTQRDAGRLDLTMQDAFRAADQFLLARSVRPL